MMHYGHANALRQSKAVGDELMVGLIPGDEALKIKGAAQFYQMQRGWSP